MIVSGINDSYVKLDNFRFGPKNTAKTASDGSYSLLYLPAGTYNLLVQPNSASLTSTNPPNGLQTVVFASNSVVSHIDFGLKQEPSPWQNSILNEDVDNRGTVDPLDVLVLVNEINRVGSYSLEGTSQVAPFFDVNGDRSIGPIDVLQVINYINRSRFGGAGEGPATTLAIEPSSNTPAPFPSFVLDAWREQSTTRIVANSTKASRLQNAGPEKCGCPGCTSFAPTGESSPAIRDIAVASHPQKPTVIEATRLGDSLSNRPFETLDEFLDSWEI